MFSILTFFLLLGCFSFSHHQRRRRGGKSRFIPKDLFSSIKRFFSSSSNHAPQPPPSPSSSTRSLRLNPPTTIAIQNHHISPCSVCGEIFQTPSLLDLHHSKTHAVSDLTDGDNIVRIIFKTGWPDKAKPPTIHRILKIHNPTRITTRFEEYRESVKSGASAAKTKTDDQRCIADGNELLRFYCTTFICDLHSTICNHQYCSACGIIRTGFSQKMMEDGITTFPTSWTAHAAIPQDLEDEFSFMHLKRALLLCRVIAGRVGSVQDSGFDSVTGVGFDDELLVFNPSAVLPCFLIVYTV
ncbi:hypothetical protein ACS0TY_022064 [Phlomoides rotata]